METDKGGSSDADCKLRGKRDTIRGIQTCFFPKEASRSFFPKEAQVGKSVSTQSLVISKARIPRREESSKARNINSEADSSAASQTLRGDRLLGWDSGEDPVSRGFVPSSLYHLAEVASWSWGMSYVLAAVWQPALELPSLKYDLRETEGPPAS